MNHTHRSCCRRQGERGQRNAKKRMIVVSRTLLAAFALVLGLNLTRAAADTNTQAAVSGPRAASPAIQMDLSRRYAVNLESSRKPLTPRPTPGLDALKGHVIYTTELAIDGKRWYRLRLGFFATRAEAERVKDTAKNFYPRAWVTKVALQEITAAYPSAPPAEPPKATVAVPARAAQPARGTATAPAAPVYPPGSPERLKALMEEARQLMANKDYSSAIRIYTKVLRYPAHAYRQDAQEFLALARDRKGQFAHAKAEYERYLQLYPKGEGAERVRQRLAALTTARKKPREKLRTGRAAKQEPEWLVFGSFSQFYRRDEDTTEQDGSTLTQSSLATDVDISARKRTQDYDLRGRFSAGHTQDFLDGGPGSTTRLISAYFDATDLNRGMAARLGRQSRNTGGVLGRFDGGLFSYQWTPRTKINLVAGYPVDSTSDALDTDRSFYGISADLGSFANAWDFVAFYIDQQIDGLTDRRAVGGEARYFDPNRSFLSLVDYDVSYREWNTVLLIGNWRFANRTTVNATIDYRKSPLLTTRNALQGQSADSIDNLLDTFSEPQIRQLALDRTALSRTVTLGLSHPLTPQWQLSTDVTATELSGTPASGGVDAVPDSGTDYYYNLQLIGSQLFKPGDISILGLRYSATASARTTSFTLNTRYPVNSAWRINPRLRMDYRDNSSDNSTQRTLAPSIRTEYRWKKRYRFELEAGGEWSDLELTTTTDETSSYFFSLGYRIDY